MSSTFTDLREARQEVVQALLQMDCIPAGMELFPAVDEEQRKFIERIIDDCDYYILILGGRYGSVDADGIGYTEREFDYAVTKGIPVLAFVHSSPDSLPPDQRELDAALSEKLMFFRERAKTGRIVKPWAKSSDLSGLVALSISHAIKTKPGLGWIRGLHEDPSALLEQINDLRKRNEQLTADLNAIPKQVTPTISLAPMTDRFTLRGEYSFMNGNSGAWRIDWTWEDIFYVIAPDLLTWQHDATISYTLARAAFEAAKSMKNPYTCTIDEDVFKTVRIQLMALGLVDVQPKTTTSQTTALFWGITMKGRTLLMQVRTVKSKDAQ